MCIICNCPVESEAALNFLRDFGLAQKSMNEAADAMLKCSNIALTSEHRAAYDRTHKQMVRLIREWNKLEHTREHPMPEGGA